RCLVNDSVRVLVIAVAADTTGAQAGRAFLADMTFPAHGNVRHQNVAGVGGCFGTVALRAGNVAVTRVWKFTRNKPSMVQAHGLDMPGRRLLCDAFNLVAGCAGATFE